MLVLLGEVVGFLLGMLQLGGNGQWLVVNVGIGFNVCVVKVLLDGGIVCFEVEEGYICLLVLVECFLCEVLGVKVDMFDLVEELFVGWGLFNLYVLWMDIKFVCVEDVVVVVDVWQLQVMVICDLYVWFFGLICCELVLCFMLMEGMFFVGSVVCSVI